MLRAALSEGCDAIKERGAIIEAARAIRRKYSHDEA